MGFRDFQLGREGVVYIAGHHADHERKGPFKIGHTRQDGSRRIKAQQTFILPGHEMELIAQHRFIDRIWAESDIHNTLAQYRIARKGQGATEFFSCSYAEVERAVALTIRREHLLRQQMLSSLEYVEKEEKQLEEAIAPRPLFLTQMLSHRIPGKKSIWQNAQEVLLLSKTSPVAFDRLLKSGIRCVPHCGVAVFRFASSPWHLLLSKLGYNREDEIFKTLVGFCDDGYPLSREELQVRCPGHDIQRLFS